ncbi:MAG: 2OG-Fe(II) oxygenase family protein [Actinomycetota bacterium]
MEFLPIIDPASADASECIDRACREVGFFAVPLPDRLAQARVELLDLAAAFFARPDIDKARSSMERGGHAWRGWFPLDGELTSGAPDHKEGYYFGTELPPDPRAMHGPNLWPDEPAALRPAVTEWMREMEELGQRLLSAMAAGLGLAADFFARGLTAAPTCLFRIFRYPPHPQRATASWGVGEHTDYGLLTLLATDGTPGLEVKSRGEWHAVAADAGLVVGNLGDMLDRLTGGRYRSNAHRVRNHADHDRYSLPFFLDPGWDASVAPLEFDDGWVTPLDTAERWDRADLRHLDTMYATYGDYLTAKTARVFPHLPPPRT